MPTVRELAPGEDALALPALRELRPHLGVDEEALAAVARLREDQGYRLLGSFPAGDPAEDGRPAAAVAGFRLVELLAWGRALYVDDLSTRAAARRRGHASALLEPSRGSPATPAAPSCTSTPGSGRTAPTPTRCTTAPACASRASTSPGASTRAECSADRHARST
jgi:GNAT superfamily N-acetyltransferase